jgi:hypothetical protein
MLSASYRPYTSAFIVATAADSSACDDSSFPAYCDLLLPAAAEGCLLKSSAAHVRIAHVSSALLPKDTRARGGLLLVGSCSPPACLQAYCRLLSASCAAGMRVGPTAAEPSAPSDPGQNASSDVYACSRLFCTASVPGSETPISRASQRFFLQYWHAAPHHPCGCSCCSCCCAFWSAAGSCCSSPDAAICVLSARALCGVLGCCCAV